jgi:glycosyltransferase involved in cell wall biosynthesis
MIPKISIALITYNGEKYIREQLDSILNQTIQDFEIVVCDDCSADSTRFILTEYAQKDTRIVLNFNEKNLGFLKNIEKAIKLCKGEFIAFADQDDIWEIEHLSVLYSNIGDNFLICGDTLSVNEEGNSLNFRLSQLFMIDINSLKNNNEHLLRLLVMDNIFQGAAMMLNRKIVDMALPFPNEIEYHDIWLALCAMAFNKFVYIPTVIIKHRRHSVNCSSFPFLDLGWKYYPKDGRFRHKIEYMTPLKRLPLSESSKQIIERVENFFLNKKKWYKNYKAMIFWAKNYRVLYAANNMNKFLIRFYKAFFKYRNLK